MPLFNAKWIYDIKGKLKNLTKVKVITTTFWAESEKF